MKFKKDTIAMLLLGTFLLNIFLAIPTGTMPTSQETLDQDLFGEIDFDFPAEDLNSNENLLSSLPENVQAAAEEIIEQADPTYPADYDIGTVLADRENFYNEISSC